MYEYYFQKRGNKNLESLNSVHARGDYFSDLTSNNDKDICCPFLYNCVIHELG